MGYCPFFQAIPESSELYELLETDRPVAKLMVLFADKGSRPLDLLEGGVDEAADLLEYALEDTDVFASRHDVDAAFRRLREAIDRAVASHPGLLDRCAFLNKSQDELERLLVLHCCGVGDESAAEFLPGLLGGVRPFARPLFEPHEGADEGESLPEIACVSPLWIVPSDEVMRAARILETLEFRELAMADESMTDATVEWLAEDYPAWRSLYLEAADRSEAVLVI